jgi:hypothetical protein
MNLDHLNQQNVANLKVLLHPGSARKCKKYKFGLYRQKSSDVLLLVANTLGFDKLSGMFCLFISYEEVFVTLTPKHNVIKLFTAVIYECL